MQRVSAGVSVPAVLLRVLVACTVVACTLGRPQVTPCRDVRDCREAFGWGTTCGDDGYCAPVELDERCDLVEPGDLFSQPEDHTDRIVFGSVYDRASFPLEMQSIALALRQANDNNGIDGRLFGLVQCNSGTDEASASLTDYLARTLGVPAIVGPATSGRVEAAYRIASEVDTLVISPSATSPALTTLDGLRHTNQSPGLLWRTAPPDDLQGLVIAQDVAFRGKSTVAVIHETGPYGEGLADVFGQEFTGSVDRFPFSTPSERDAAILDVNADAAYDEVLFVSSETRDIRQFLLGAATLGWDRGIFLTDGAFDTDLLEAARTGGAIGLLPLIRGTHPAEPSGDVYQQFVASFAAAFSGLDATSSAFTPYAYDAAWLTAYGAAWAVSNEPDLGGTSLARGLRRVSRGPDLPIRPSSWSEIRATLEAGDPVDVQGASGTLDFDPQTEETSAPIDVWAVNATNDGFVILGTVNP